MYHILYIVRLKEELYYHLRFIRYKLNHFLLNILVIMLNKGFGLILLLIFIALFKLLKDNLIDL
jgi:hypothetical protein